MKNSFFLYTFAIVSLLSVIDANATIRRVGYFGTPVSGTDYGDLQSAHNAAAAGDTLLMFPGNYSATFSKRLIVIGYGYYLTGAGADSGLQVITGVLNVGITMYAGSDSTVLEGLSGLTVSSGTNITIKGVSIAHSNIGLSYDHSATLADWSITKSVFYFYTSPFQGYDTFQSLKLENDIITGIDLTYSTSSSTGVFNNNIFITTPNFNNGSYSLANNIFLSTTAPSNALNSTFYNNIASNNIIPYGNGNQPNVNLSTVFVGYPNQGTYSNDGRYMLASGSPAIGTGEGGIDCGIYGGIHPYHLAGIPPIPSFYKLMAPSNITSGNPYTITFSVRSNN